MLINFVICGFPTLVFVCSSAGSTTADNSADGFDNLELCLTIIFFPINPIGHLGFELTRK